ncbi:MAG: RsmE family RNA methyltransferase [Bacteroidota bacterium]
MENNIAGLECLYAPELHENSTDLLLKGDEARHLKVLRKREGEHVALTNGKGIFAEAGLLKTGRDTAELQVLKTFKNYGEPVLKIGLALGILENKDRFEFALEKCTELGIAEFFPLKSDFVQRKQISIERLQTKAIAAMKQCKRSILPQIHEPKSVVELLKNADYDVLIFADMEGESFKNVFKKFLKEENPFKSALIIAGPEGGFSTKEIEILRNDKRCVRLLLGERRLRAETAAIVSVGLVSVGF